MPLDEPAWWYRTQPTLSARMLAPVAGIWGYVAERRMVRTVPYRSTLPVVCIGNFTAGGTGKTPLTRVVAGILGELGHAPVALTRGYGGTCAGPHQVHVRRDSSAIVGDEPLLLAATLPVMISRNRAAGAGAIEAMAAPADGRSRVIVMDDGLQNPALAKDLTIAVVDGRRGLGNGRVMPAGPLRAPIERQLSRVDAIVVNRQGQADPAGADAVARHLRAQFSGPVLQAATVASGNTGWLGERPVIAFAGIGAPQRFFALLSTLGATMAGQRSFPDHHAFSEIDAGKLLAEAASSGAGLVSTEKDWVRLSGRGPKCTALQAATRVLRIELALDASDRGTLVHLLRDAIARRAAKPATKPA